MAVTTHGTGGEGPTVHNFEGYGSPNAFHACAVVALVAAALGGGWWFWGDPVRNDSSQDSMSKLAQGVKDASNTLKAQFVEARTSAKNFGLQQQVGARIHNDKVLDAGRIEIEVEDESTAILDGIVPDRAAKERAVELTRDTRGVQRVVDRLAVPPPPRIISAP